MILSMWPRLASLLLLLAHAVPAAAPAAATASLSAFAENLGDMAAWQVCDLRPGITATFSPNPSYGRANRHGIIADRAHMTLHVATSVPPGDYTLVFLSYSYLAGPGGPAMTVEYLPRLRVLFNHRIRFPQFNHWPGMDVNDSHAVVPQGPCTELPKLT